MKMHQFTLFSSNKGHQLLLGVDFSRRCPQQETRHNKSLNISTHDDSVSGRRVKLLFWALVPIKFLPSFVPSSRVHRRGFNLFHPKEEGLKVFLNLAEVSDWGFVFLKGTDNYRKQALKFLHVRVENQIYLLLWVVTKSSQDTHAQRFCSANHSAEIFSCKDLGSLTGGKW